MFVWVFLVQLDTIIINNSIETYNCCNYNRSRHHYPSYSQKDCMNHSGLPYFTIQSGVKKVSTIIIISLRSANLIIINSRALLKERKHLFQFRTRITRRHLGQDGQQMAQVHLQPLSTLFNEGGVLEI